MRQLSCLLHISCTDLIILDHKASRASMHSCRRTCLQQCWHIWICQRKFLGVPDVWGHCGQWKASRVKRLPWVMSALWVSGHLLPLSHSSKYQLLQEIMQAKLISFKSFFVFYIVVVISQFPALSSLTHPHCINTVKGLFSLRWLSIFTFICTVVRAWVIVWDEGNVVNFLKYAITMETIDTYRLDIFV